MVSRSTMLHLLHCRGNDRIIAKKDEFFEKAEQQTQKAKPKQNNQPEPDVEQQLQAVSARRGGHQSKCTSGSMTILTSQNLLRGGEIKREMRESVEYFNNYT